MTLRLGLNISSLKAQRKLSETSTELTKTFERLSSGMRINSASDDAASLAIADSLQADRRVLNQGVRNIHDGISLLNIADSALESLTEIVVRLKELAEQAASGSYSSIQRQALDLEAQKLSDEFFRIRETTTFNDRNVLDGSVNQLQLQAGYGTDGLISGSLGGNIGTGTFSSQISYNGPATEGSSGAAFGDLNNDGNLDIIVSGSNFGFVTGFVAIQLGNGDGTFGSVISYAQHSSTSETALGDINGDGILDMVSAGRTAGYDGYTIVRIGNGDGTFGEGVSYQAESRVSTAVKLEDLNNDGLLDMISAGQTDGFRTQVTIRLGDGTGSFGAATTYEQAGNSGASVQIVDVNNDGIEDIISGGTVTTGSDGVLSVRIGNGDGTFGDRITFAAETGGHRKFTVGDVNGDGFTDIVSGGLSDAQDGYATVFLGNGTGTFTESATYSTESRATRGVTLGDINGDGLLDLVTAGYDDDTTAKITVRLGTGGGAFGESTTIDGNGAYATTVNLEDLNNDGVLDLIHLDRQSGPLNGLHVWLGETRPGTAPLLEFSLNSIADARQALSQFTHKLNQLTSQRAEIGAFQSRLGFGLRHLQTTADTYATAESRLRDADISAEAANLVRLQILQQASAAVLAQANLEPQLVLKLLN